MNALLFYLFFGFTWLLAQLPRFILSFLSELTFLIIYYVVGYRKKVVKQNLKNSFPNKTTKELKKIERKFFRHLCDMMFENIFLMHASKRRVASICKFNNLELIDDLYKRNRSFIQVSGHYGNWELYSLMRLHIDFNIAAIYKPLSNKRFEKLLNNARERFGCFTAPMKDTLRVMIQHRQENKPLQIGLVADQTPARGDIRYWTTFLNQQTAVFLGVEKLAQKFDYPVVFSVMKKKKRWHYEVYFELLTETPNNFKPYELTELHLKRLEKDIIEQPEFWLWSHRRWKRRPEETPQAEIAQ